MSKSSATKMKDKRERDYQLLLESFGSEKKLSDTGLIEVIGRCYRQSKRSGNTEMLKIALCELDRKIKIIDGK